MYNNRLIAKGLVFGIVLSNVPVGSMANAIEEYKIIKEEREFDSSQSRGSAKEKKIKNPVKANKNINVGTVLEITVGDGDYVPDLTGNPDGFETIRVTTIGNKKTSNS